MLFGIRAIRGCSLCDHNSVLRIRWEFFEKTILFLYSKCGRIILIRIVNNVLTVRFVCFDWIVSIALLPLRKKWSHLFFTENILKKIYAICAETLYTFYEIILFLTKQFNFYKIIYLIFIITDNSVLRIL